MKLEKMNDTGFVASIKSDVIAGMEYKNGKIINPKLRKIGTKVSYFNMICYPDGDISFGEKIHNFNQK